MDLIIRKAESADAKQFAEILTQATQYKLAHGDSAWGTEAYTTEEILSHISEGCTWVATIGKILVGHIITLQNDELVWGKQPPLALYAHQLATKDGYRGLNIGGQLLDRASQQAAIDERQFLRIDFSPENDGLRIYYENLGFQFVEKRLIEAPHATYTAALYQRSTLNTQW